MSQGMTIGGALGASSAPMAGDTVKNQAPAPVLTGGAMLPANLNNYHDLKMAELKGESLSISQEHVVKAIEQAIKAAQGKTTELSFSVHSKTKLISVKVLDKESGTVIREIPPEKTLDFVAKLWEMAGIIIDERR